MGVVGEIQWMEGKIEAGRHIPLLLEDGGSACYILPATEKQREAVNYLKRSFLLQPPSLP